MGETGVDRIRGRERERWRAREKERERETERRRTTHCLVLKWTMQLNKQNKANLS